MSAGLATAIRQGAQFVASVQLASGNFESFSSPSRKPFRQQRTYQTTFASSLILAALSRLPEAEIPKTRHKLADWLLTQKNDDWAFTYWASEEPVRHELPYPADLDDTFCALVALHAHNPSLIDAACLGRVVQLLIATETQVGGPYRTWLVTKEAPSKWQDVDLAVNSNIAYFLSLVAEPLPSLTAFMEQAITNRRFASPYYPSPYPLAYYLARAYRGPGATKLADWLLAKRKQGHYGSPLKNALAVSALEQLGRHDDCQQAVAYLVQTQESDGSWPAEAFCLDPMLEGKKYYSGAPALTTALAIEALARYSRPPEKPKTRPASDNPALHDRIVASAQAELQQLDPSLAKPGQAILQKIASRETGQEITLLPYLFYKDLARAAKQPVQLYLDLGLANLYGWTAYTIYDDFLDNEGDPKLLSAANVCLRNSLRHFYQTLPNHQAFHELVGRTFDVIDGANAWEVSHCRFSVTDEGVDIGALPKFGSGTRLAERSLGHTLGPLGVLAAGGAALDSPAVGSITDAFKHYLIARQLDDDLHDWEQDLRNGIVTYVTVQILNELSVSTGYVSFAKLLPKMQRQFWHHTLPAVCKTITGHTAKARRAARKSGLLKTENQFIRRMDIIDASVAGTLAEQADAKQFLSAYSGSDEARTNVS